MTEPWKVDEAIASLDSLLDRLAKAEEMEKAATANAATMSTLLQSIRRQLAKAEQERDEAKELLRWWRKGAHGPNESISLWHDTDTFLNQKTKR